MTFSPTLSGKPCTDLPNKTVTFSLPKDQAGPVNNSVSGMQNKQNVHLVTDLLKISGTESSVPCPPPSSVALVSPKPSPAFHLRPSVSENALLDGFDTEYSPAVVDAMFATGGAFWDSDDEADKPEKDSRHTIKGNQEEDAPQALPPQGQMAFLAIPVELLQNNKGLTVEQVAQGILDMRSIASRLASGTPSKAPEVGTSLPEKQETGTAEDGEGGRFPTYENGRCSHRKCWKRLRAKRGYTYFICLQCTLKWRSTGQSEKARQNKLTSYPCDNDCKHPDTDPATLEGQW
jgi:hypothetical protein